MYQLNVDFSSTDLGNILAADEMVVITKQTSGSSSSAVAWIAFSPLQANSVTWTDSYTLYASRTALQNGATISMLSQAAALETESLPFTNSGSFGPADPTVVLATGQYGVENQYTTTPTMVFGLAQEANITGTAMPASPINATLVPENQDATFTPMDIIQVFVTSSTNNGMVISTVTSNALTVDFGGTTTEVTVTYDSAVGGFQLTNSN